MLCFNGQDMHEEQFYQGWIINDILAAPLQQ